MSDISDAVLRSRQLTDEQQRVWDWFKEQAIDPGPAAYDAILGSVGRRGLTADDLIGHYAALVEKLGQRVFTKAHGELALLPQGRRFTSALVEKIRSGEWAETVAKQYADARAK